MPMTRRNFEAIAEALASTRPDSTGPSDLNYVRRLQWEWTRAALADALAADNPRFNRGRFFVACEGGTSRTSARALTPDASITEGEA